MDEPSVQLPVIGDRVGDYRIVGVLGRGGHGHVYRAEAFGRAFALKFMDPGLERFGEREVHALVHLKHRGVVGFLGCGRWKDPEHGLFYVVMEFVEGLTLYEYVLLYNPSARKVGELLLALGRTLVAVQSAGVLHGDLKPENIMVRLPREEPVLLDFGLAARTGARPEGEDEEVEGTLEYLSPEAWEHMGASEESYRPTPQDEQWALGVTFYWMLADRLPFGERGDSRLMRRVLREQPKAPDVVNSRVPLELGAICMRMLEKNPEDRYSDLREMCRELRQALEVSASVEGWRLPLIEVDGPEWRTTDIDAAILAAQGIPLELARLRRPRRGRVRKRPEGQAPAAPGVAVPPPEPVPRAAEGPGVGGEEAAPARQAAVVLEVPAQAPVEPAPKVEPPSRPSGRQRVGEGLVASWRQVAWGGMVLWLGLALSPTLPAQLPIAPQPAGEASDLASWQVGSTSQKLAPALYSQQSASGAALTPAPVAVATLSQDEPDVKTPVKKTGLAPVKKTAAAAVAAMVLGCPTAHVRPPPEPMECPPGALENMEKLGIKRGDWGSFRFESHQGRPAFIPVKEGWTSFSSVGGFKAVERQVLRQQGRLPEGPVVERLSGRVLFGGERVYGRLTQATLSDGTTLRVCMELFDYEEDNKRGLRCEPTSSPDTVKAGSLVLAKPVDHFE